MNSNTIRKSLTILLILLGLIVLLDIASLLGSGGILNELDQAVEETIELEKKGLLHEAPERISSTSLFYLKKYHNSSGLKQHIKEYEEEFPSRFIIFCILSLAFLLCLFLRIYFRKGKA